MGSPCLQGKVTTTHFPGLFQCNGFPGKGTVLFVNITLSWVTLSLSLSSPLTLSPSLICQCLVNVRIEKHFFSYVIFGQQAAAAPNLA